MMDSYVITIGRQFGCGGREIGRLVAQQLGIAYYDKELLVEAAHASGVSADFMAASDERAPRFFSSLWAFNPTGNNGAYFLGGSPQSDDRVYEAQSRVIVELADRGPCVMVGRTADYVLRNHCRVVSVFVHAPLDQRVQRIIERGDCAAADEAQRMAERQNKARADYYNFYTGRHWGDAANYDLCVNSGLLEVEGTASTIAHFARQVVTLPGR